MSDDLTINVTELQVEAARINKQYFFWRIVRDNGKVIDQFDPLTGEEQKFPDWCHWVQKSPGDVYSSTPAFTGIKEAFWVPAIPGLDSYYVSREDAHSIILYRKNYIRTTGTKYVVYCIGRRWEGDNCREATYHICPPARYHKETDLLEDAGSSNGILFPGAVTLVTSPLQGNAFDIFLESMTRKPLKQND